MATGGGSSPSSDEEGLGDDDLKRMYDILFPVSCKSRLLGVQLGLSFAEIRNIHTQYADSGIRLLEVLGCRIRKAKPLTWKCIYEALEAESIGEYKLANKILKKYGHLFSPEPVRKHDIKEHDKKGKGRRLKTQGGEMVGGVSPLVVKGRESLKQDSEKEVSGRKMPVESYNESEKSEISESNEEMSQSSSGEEYTPPQEQENEVANRRGLNKKMKKKDMQKRMKSQDNETNKNKYYEHKKQREKSKRKGYLQPMGEKQEHTKKSKSDKESKVSIGEEGATSQMEERETYDIKEKMLEKEREKRMKGTINISGRKEGGSGGGGGARETRINLRSTGKGKNKKQPTENLRALSNKEGHEPSHSKESEREICLEKGIVKHGKEGRRAESSAEEFSSNEEKESKSTDNEYFTSTSEEDTSGKTMSVALRAASKDENVTHDSSSRERKKPKKRNKQRERSRDNEDSSSPKYNHGKELNGDKRAPESPRIGVDIKESDSNEARESADNESSNATSEEDKKSLPSDENKQPDTRDTTKSLVPAYVENVNHDSSSRDRNKPKKRNKQRERSRDNEDSSSPLVSPKESQPVPRGRKNRERRENAPGSSATDESSPESNESKTLTQSETKALLKMFDRYFGKLCLAMKEPVETAAQLQSESILSISTMEDIIVSPESQQSKAITVVRVLQKGLKSRPDKVCSIARVFVHIPFLQDIGREIMTEAGRICPDLVTADSEIRTQTDLQPHPPPNDEASSTPAELNKQANTANTESQVPTQQPTTRGRQTSVVVSGSVPESELSPELQKYRQYLQSVYRARKLAASDKYLPTLDSPYINLAMINRGSHNEGDRDEFTRQTLHGGVDQILANKTPIHIEDLLVPLHNNWESESGFINDTGMLEKLSLERWPGSNSDHARFVLVEGPPGIGKSTFAWEICRRWNEIESLRKFLIILLLKLREKWVLNATSLADLFRYEYDPGLSEKIVREFSHIQKKVLIILDGFDEVSHSFHEDSIIKRILRRELLPGCTIILTTRPSAKATLHSICQPRVDKHVEIIGFTEEERVRYIIEVFSNEPELQANFLKYMFLVPHIKSMMYIPLNCAIIAQVYYESQSSCHLAIPKTRTQLYMALTHSLLVRHTKTKEGSREYTGMLPEGLNKEDMEKFKVLTKFAFDTNHKEGESRKVTFFNEDIPEGLVHFGFMNESSEMYAGKGVEKTLSFLHLSLQEYLAAWHLAHSYSTEFQVDYHSLALVHSQSRKNSFPMPSFNTSVQDKKVLLQSLMSLEESLVEPAVFLAGITGWRCQSDDVRNLWETYLSHDTAGVDDTNLLLRSLYEAQNPIIIPQYFINEKRRNLSIGSDESDRSTQTPYDCYALSYCVANSSDQFRLSVDVRDESDVSLVETFVKGIDDHCKSTTPAVKNLKLNLNTNSTESIKRCLFWLNKVVFASEIERMVLNYKTKKLPFSQEFLQSLYKLKSLITGVPPRLITLLSTKSVSRRVTRMPLASQTEMEDSKIITLEWLPALQSLTELKLLHIKFPDHQCIPPSTGFDCLPVEYKLREVVLNIILPSYKIYDICSPTDKMIGCLLKLAARSHHNLTRIRLPEKSISRETMAGVRSILLHCPNLESLDLKRTRLGYDGILFICSALRFNTSLKHLQIHDDPLLPLEPPQHDWENESCSSDSFEVVPTVSFKSEKRVALPDKTTCTDFLLQLNNILKKNTTLEDIDIQSGLFLPLSTSNKKYSQWTGLGPLEQFNMGAVASGRSLNLRRSFSSSDLTQPQTTRFWYREYQTPLFEYGPKKINFRKINFKKMFHNRYFFPSFTAPDTEVLHLFSGLDHRLKKCLENNFHRYSVSIRLTYNGLLIAVEQEANRRHCYI